MVEKINQYKSRYFLLGCFMSLFWGCSDFLDVVPDDIATIDDAFVSEISAEKYLFTCYSWMPELANLNSNPAFYGGDESYRDLSLIQEGGMFTSGYAFNAQDIAIGNQTADNPIIDYWSGNSGGRGLYKAIRDCNTFLENIHKVSIIEESLRSRWIAEVKFLKAYYHFFLFRMYGPIVIWDINLPIGARIEEIQKSRNTVDECVAYISDLFLEASVDLPNQIFDPLNELGRATSLAALALRARVLTMGASPLFNGNGDYANLIDDKRGALFSQSYDGEKWTIAAAACKLAITEAETSGVKLYEFLATDLENLPSTVAADQVPKEVINMLTIQQSLSERWTDEKFFVTTKGSTRILQQHAMARTYSAVGGNVTNGTGAYGVYSPTLRIAEMFYTKRGVPIDEDRFWNYSDRYKLRNYNSNNDEDFDLNGVPDNKYFVKNNESTVNLHFDRETRFYGSLGFDRGIWITAATLNGNGLSAFESHYVKARSAVSEYSSALSGGLGRGSQTGYFAKKLTSYKNSINSSKELSTVEYQFPEMRLSDLYLLYAECLNEIDDRVNAYVYIDKIRERASLKGVVESWMNYSVNPSKPNSKAGLRQIIQQERLIELVFEGQRFWDLKRWKLAEGYLIRPFKGWNFKGINAEEYYDSPRVIGDPSYSFKHNLWPIATDEILANPNTFQNGGW